MLKPWVWILIGLGLAVVVGSGIYIWLLKTQPKMDFGDAPDKALAYKIDKIEIAGQFPSLEKSNGARVKRTDEVWLGEKVDKEKDSVQVDQDAFDDGFGADLNSCAESMAYFIVQVANPGKMSGTAYLNLFYDWNKDGQWSGKDDCASEWVIQNYPVDLSQQDVAIRAYLPTFIAGKIADNSKDSDYWHRAVVTFNQQMASENGTGEFASGEIEDYGPPIYEDENGNGGGKTYSVSCDPDPAFAEHGKETEIKIEETPFSETYTEHELANNMVAKTDEREIKITGEGFTYNPKLDPPKQAILETVSVRVRYGPDGKEASIVADCPVWAIHDEIPILKIGGVEIPKSEEKTTKTGTTTKPTTTPTPGTTPSETPTPASTPTLTAWFEHSTEYTEQGYPSVVGVYIKPTDTAGKNITSCHFDLTNIFSDPSSVTYYALNINQSGDVQGWTCTPETGSFYYNCSGSTALAVNRKSIYWFYYGIMLNWSVIPSLLPYRCSYDGGSVEGNAEKR